MTKLDEAAVGEILTALRAGESKKAIAHRYKTYPARIREIGRGITPPPPPPSISQRPPDAFDVVRAVGPLIPSLANLPPAAPSYPLDLEDLPRRLCEAVEEIDAFAAADIHPD